MYESKYNPNVDSEIYNKQVQNLNSIFLDEYSPITKNHFITRTEYNLYLTCNSLQSYNEVSSYLTETYFSISSCNFLL